MLYRLKVGLGIAVVGFIIGFPVLVIASLLRIALGGH
jgi:hypothetical protein